MAMSIVYVIFIKDLLASDLMIKSEINKILEKKISDIPYNEVIIDFSNVRAMSREFINQYKQSKFKNRKEIHEVNIPLGLQETFDSN